MPQGIANGYLQATKIKDSLRTITEVTLEVDTVQKVQVMRSEDLWNSQ